MFRPSDHEDGTSPSPDGWICVRELVSCGRRELGCGPIEQVWVGDQVEAYGRQRGHAFTAAWLFDADSHWRLALEWLRGRELPSLLRDFEFVGGFPAGIVLRPEVASALAVPS